MFCLCYYPWSWWWVRPKVFGATVGHQPYLSLASQRVAHDPLHHHGPTDRSRHRNQNLRVYHGRSRSLCLPLGCLRAAHKA
eukprot:2815300-Amphidinium_carterae.2